VRFIHSLKAYNIMKFRLTSIYIFLFFINAIGAIAIGGVPIQWFSTIGVALLCIFFFYKFRLVKQLQPGLFTLFCLWSFGITIYKCYTIQFDWPADATTSLKFYLFLRFLNLLSFFLFAVWSYQLCINGDYTKLISGVAKIGFIIAIVSIYIYFAQLFGLPDIPRTRLGTAGGEQATTFSSLFHRAMGTFREPSHLAEWLVVPFFISMQLSKKKARLYCIIIGITIFLTGSLTAILSIVGSIVIYYLIVNFLKIISLAAFSFSFFKDKFVFVAKIIFYVSALFFIDFLLGSKLYFIGEAIYERVDLLFFSGLSGSNRSYIYKFMDITPIPFFGYGLGVSNTMLSNFVQTDNVVSFLSLYYLNLFSTGIVGLAILILFLLYPVTQIIKLIRLNLQAGNTKSNKYDFIFISYITWLIMFIVHSEELTLSFAVSYALTIYVVSREKSVLLRFKK
jgi:hypothetical protein